MVYGAEERKKRSRFSRTADTPGGVESRSVEVKELKMDIYWDQHKKYARGVVRSYREHAVAVLITTAGWRTPRCLCTSTAVVGSLATAPIIRCRCFTRYGRS